MSKRSNGWGSVLLHALPLSLFLLGLFYYWFAIANRHVIFLYEHLDAAPFDETTSSRYWMSSLVASGAVMVLYTAANWLFGRLAGLRYRRYSPPIWWRVWLLCAAPLAIGITMITMSCNRPTLPFPNAASCVVSALPGLALALMPGSLAAERPSELGWLIAYGLGLMPSLLLLRAIELPGRGLAGFRQAYSLAIGSVLAGVAWSGIVTWLRAALHKPVIEADKLLVAGLCLSYLLLPLLHYLALVPPEYRYISASSNFFAFSLGIQLLSFLVAAVLAVGITQLQRRLQ